MAVKKKSAKKKTAPKKKTVTKKVATKKPARKTTGAVTAPAPAAPAAVQPINAEITAVTVRMYCHGFGDCFLLSFMAGPQAVFRMVIDCGLLTGKTERLQTVIKNIAADCNGVVDLVVQTHQHKDHVSGFNLKDKQGNLLWDAITVKNVWLAWTENTGKGGDDLAKKLSQLHKKRKTALTRAVGMYNKHIESPRHKRMMNNTTLGTSYVAAQQRYTEAMKDILNFFDIGDTDISNSLHADGTEFGLTVKDAMEYFVKKKKTNGQPDITYWDPGEYADESVTGLPGINFYFLGPPKNYAQLKQMDDKTHEEMYMTDMGLSDNFYMALESDMNNAEQKQLSPFHAKYSCAQDYYTKEDLENENNVLTLYHSRKNYWREIETDWLNNAGALALALDSYTNNTSLVIAIELVKTKKVLMFVADAQIGNWKSWTEPVSDKDPTPKLTWKIKEGSKLREVTAADLLSRTIFYKVGHHASHNATGKKHGLELMTSSELVAFIPVDEAVAKEQGKRGWKMPAEDLYKRLIEKTKGRIVRLDKGNLLTSNDQGIDAAARPSEKQRLAFNANVRHSKELIKDDNDRNRPLYWEYDVLVD